MSSASLTILPRRPTALQQAVVVAFVLVLGGLILRTHWMDDDRYGYSMFRSVSGYEIRMDWVFADGRTEKHTPQRDLHKRVRGLFKEGWRDTAIGIGAIRSRVISYGEYQFRERRPRGAVQFRITLTHALYDGPRVTERISIPERVRQ